MSLPGEYVPTLGAQLSLQITGTLLGNETFVRTNGTEVYLAPIDGMNEWDVEDTHFRKVAGLSDSNCVSFESLKFPGRFLRHQNDRLTLAGSGFVPSFFNFSFNADATFCAHASSGTPTNYAYESVNKRGYYIQKSGSELVLSQLGLQNFNERPPARLGFSVRTGIGAPIPSEYWFGQVSGACTGLSPLWGTPQTSSVILELFEIGIPGRKRIVTSSATGSTWAGWYPWIKYTSTQVPAGYGEYPFKIETGRSVCVW